MLSLLTPNLVFKVGGKPVMLLPLEPYQAFKTSTGFTQSPGFYLFTILIHQYLFGG